MIPELKAQKRFHFKMEKYVVAVSLMALIAVTMGTLDVLIHDEMGQNFLKEKNNEEQ
jgi:hypothetical protein